MLPGVLCVGVVMDGRVLRKLLCVDAEAKDALPGGTIMPGDRLLLLLEPIDPLEARDPRLPNDWSMTS